MQREGGVALNDRDTSWPTRPPRCARSSSTSCAAAADRRGGGAEHVTLDTQAAESLGATDDEILAVHDALGTLAHVDARLVRVVEMRYFAGLSDIEIGAALGVTDRTVRRDWERARLLLAEMLGR